MTRACGLCGTPCPPPFRVPAAELAPDLDGRPGEPARSTLARWVVRCRRCGAAAPDLAALPETAARTVENPAYAAESDDFLRWFLICQDADQPGDAAEALLQAAWRAEDQGHDAAPLRRRAADLWQGDPLRRIDILRRAGAFPEARSLLDQLGEPDADSAAILAFQRARIDAADAGRYAISSALRPPARTPHVAHTQKPARGFFARLFAGRDHSGMS